MDLRAEGDLLIVHERARIPKVCVKCGATKDVARREMPFGVGHTTTGAGMAGGALGAVVASVLRNALRDEPGLQALILALLLGGGILVVWVISTRTPKIHIQVPLCAEHTAGLERALRNRVALLVAFGIAAVLFLLGIGAEAVILMLLGGAVIAGALAAVFAMRMKEAWVAARWAKDEEVALVVGAETAAKIVARAQKRAAKKRREALASAS